MMSQLAFLMGAVCVGLGLEVRRTRSKQKTPARLPLAVRIVTGVVVTVAVISGWAVVSGLI